MEVVVIHRPGCRRFPASRIRLLANRVLRAVGASAGSVSILLTRDDEMRRLNRRFRDKDRSTDVLSFPMGEGVPSGAAYLGDIAISVEAAARQARATRRKTGEEIQLLVLHGLLHLLGYDHETDRGEMNRLQSSLVRRILGQKVSPAILSAARFRSRAAHSRKTR